MALFSAFIFLANFLLVCYSIKKIIYIAHKKHLFDEPSEVRKIHLTRTPNLGGVAIFSSMMFTSCLFLSSNILHLNYIIFSALILFILGVTDDLVGVNPTKKIIAQLTVALTISILADVRFTNFYGFFGMHDTPYAVSIFVSGLFIIFLINAFNLIDGINCLAGSIGFLACLVLSFYFWQMQQPGLLFIAIATAGCLAGFLVFNRTPAKIFMGDTGSMFLGFIAAFLSINFIELNIPGNTHLVKPVMQSAPALIIALLIVPIFDTLRIFAMRIAQRKSPFTADSNHIHHRLINLSLSHLQATGVLLIATIICLLFIYLFYYLKSEILIFMVAIFTLVANAVLSFLHKKKKSEIPKNTNALLSYQIKKRLIILKDKPALK